MNNIVCFDAAAQRRHQDQIDATDRATKLHNEARHCAEKQLRAGLLLGLQQQHGATIPAPVLAFYPINNKLVQEPLAECINQLLDNAPVFEALMLVLRDSECEHVKALRVAMADQLVLERADDLASYITGE